MYDKITDNSSKESGVFVTKRLVEYKQLINGSGTCSNNHLTLNINKTIELVSGINISQLLPKEKASMLKLTSSTQELTK